MTSGCFWGVFVVVLGVFSGWFWVCAFFVCLGVCGVCVGCFCGVFLWGGGVFGCLFIFLVKGVSSPLQHAT